MTDMKRILDSKGYSFFFIEPDAKVSEAVAMLDRKKVGFLLVMHGEHMEGVFSERDVVKLLARMGPSVLDLPIHDVMTTQIYHVTLSTDVDECMGLMSQQGIRHVPVTDGKLVVGVVSIRDVVGAVVEDREITIQGLENYLVGQEFES
jgi:CBS domain-containing protein